MKAVRLLCLLVLLPLCGMAQTVTLSGRVMDTMNNRALGKASITLITAADSILVDYGRSKEDGAFRVQADSPGEYLLLISFPSFADYVEHVTLKSGNKDMGEVALITRSKLLSEFVYRQARGSIKIKGDTIEYLADSFLVREGANVEELLKKLPGLQVNKNGEVTAQGEKVSKILVDGEEFFSDDPAVVTKSLQAKTVEKVQVYDKKSDAAEFSGIDDGIKEKTINLTLKENMKKGFFGKVQLGGGTGSETDGFYENQLMINSFRGRRQLSAFAILSNTPNIGLNWQDRDKYTGGGGNIISMDEDGGRMYTYFDEGEDGDGGGWNGTYNGQGLPQVATAGLHFANRWAGEKQHISGNYRYAKQRLDMEGSTITQYILPDSSYTSEQTNTSVNNIDRHRGDGLYEWKMDSTSSLKVTVNAGVIKSNDVTTAFTTSKSASDVPLNTSDRKTNGESETITNKVSLQYRKKLGKAGRTISANLEENYRGTESLSSLYASNTFYTGGGQSFTTVTDQLKDNNSTRMAVNGGLNYTEPLSKKTFLEFRYGLQLQNNTAKRLSFNKDVSGEGYTVLDSLFSSDYEYRYLTNTGGAFVRVVLKKFRFSAGGSVAHTSFNQQDNFRDTTRKRSFTNFFPSANMTYKLSAQSDIYFSYSGATTQPTIDQIQPLRQNSDPLNIQVGNPELRQQFNHAFNLRYHDYKVITGTYTYAGGGVTFTEDDISNSETITPFGARQSSYVNIDGNYNGYFYGGMGMRLKAIEGSRVGFNTNLNFNRNNTYVNGLLNNTNNNTYGLGLDLNYEKEKKIDFSLRPQFNYNQNTSSISTQVQSYWTTNVDMDATIDLPWSLQTNVKVNWTLRERTEIFQKNNNVVLLSAWIAKKFGKNKQLELRATGYDLLNQNIGFQRAAYGNTVNERNYTTIKRYGLLSLIWNFTYSPAGKPAEEEGGMKIKL